MISSVNISLINEWELQSFIWFNQFHFQAKFETSVFRTEQNAIDISATHLIHTDYPLPLCNLIELNRITDPRGWRQEKRFSERIAPHYNVSPRRRRFVRGDERTRISDVKEFSPEVTLIKNQHSSGPPIVLDTLKSTLDYDRVSLVKGIQHTEYVST